MTRISALRIRMEESIIADDYDDLALEQAIYQRAAEVTRPQLADLFASLRDDVTDIAKARARAMADLPPLDANQQAQVDAQRMTPAEVGGFAAIIEQLGHFDEADVMYVIEELVRDLLDQAQMFGFLYEDAPEAYAQILECRQAMLDRVTARGLA